MAASLGKHTKLTLSVTRKVFFDKNRRAISTGQAYFGNTWHVRDKPRRQREIYNAPAIDEKSVKAEKQDIVIPNKIERSPTAVLEALASAVRNDLNQPMYTSIDDPHLYATQDRIKKSHLAAMDSGRKAAQMMLSMYPDYFSQIWDEPLPNFVAGPQDSYKYNEPSENALLERITKQKVKDAITVYKALKANNSLPSQEALEKFLELLTVFNCQDQENISDLSTFVNAVPLRKHVPFPVCTWKKGNMSEQVFNALPHKTAKAYCSILRGMAANYDKVGAMNMYNEMKAANLQADVYTYNQLLRLAALESESMDDVSHYIEALLSDMATYNVRPNEDTFISVLSNCKRLSRWTGSKKYALSVLSEMKACGIVPTLATFVELMNIFYYQNDKAPKDPALFENILTEVMDKEFKCRCENDILFFRTAIRVIATHLPDSKLALKLHKLLKTGKNNDLLGHRQIQYGYYTDLFAVIIPVEHIDVIMDIYCQEVPYNFSPSSVAYKSILESIQMYDSYHYLPQIYTDVQWTSMFVDQEFLHLFAQTMARQKHDPQLQGQMCSMASSLLKKWAEKRNTFSRDIPKIDGATIGEFMIVYLDNNQLSEAWELFELYLNERSLRATDPSERALTKLIEHLLAEEDYTSTKKVINQMSHLEYTGLSSVVEKALQTFSLPEQERNYLRGLAVEASSDNSSSDSD